MKQMKTDIIRLLNSETIVDNDSTAWEEWHKIVYKTEIEAIKSDDSQFQTHLPPGTIVYKLTVEAAVWHVDSDLYEPDELDGMTIDQVSWSYSKPSYAPGTLRMELAAVSDSVEELQAAFDVELMILHHSFGMNFSNMEYALSSRREDFEMADLLKYGKRLGIANLDNTMVFLENYLYLQDRAYQSNKVPEYLASRSIDFMPLSPAIIEQFN